MLQDGEKGVIIQRDKKTYAVAPHIPCGVVKPETLRKIADVAEKYGAQALKITSAARIAMVGIDEKNVDDIRESFCNKCETLETTGNVLSFIFKNIIKPVVDAIASNKIE